ncbi:hypothetical protein HY992_05135 [Candidatus Micrarchaeota archaeon]|nr:hypothetical protein [Candidatus Micrarchaeota archaeon]
MPTLPEKELNKIRILSAEHEQKLRELKRAYAEKINALKANEELSLAEKEKHALALLDDFHADYKRELGASKKQVKKIVEDAVPGPDKEKICARVAASNKNPLTRPIPDSFLRIALELHSSAGERLEEWRAFKEACSLFKASSAEDAECELLEQFISWRDKEEKTAKHAAVPDFLEKQIGAKDAAKLWRKIMMKVQAFEVQVEELKRICKRKIEKARLLDSPSERKQRLHHHLERFDAECRKACKQFITSMQREIQDAIPSARPADVKKTIHHLNKNKLARWLPDSAVELILTKLGTVKEKYFEKMAFAAATSLYTPKRLEQMKKQLVEELVKDKILEQK